MQKPHELTGGRDMMIDLICPHCQAVVAAREADRGESVRCGICLGEVPVPAVEPYPLAAETGKSTTLPTAKLLSAEEADLHPAPKRVIATPIYFPPAAPLPMPVSPLRDNRIRSPKNHFVRREEGEDEDLPDEAGSKSQAGLILIVSLLGLLFFGAIAFGVIYFLQGSGKGSSDGSKNGNADGYVDPQPLWNPNKDPGKPGVPPVNVPIPPFRPAPFLRPPVVPNVPAPRPQIPDWLPVDRADGFTAKVPGKLMVADGKRMSGRIKLSGRSYGPLTYVQPGVVWATFQIEYYDVPAGVEFDEDKTLRDMAALPNGLVGPGTLAGRACRELTGKIGGRNLTARGVKVGPRFFVVKFEAWFPQTHPQSEEYKAKYFDSFRITYDPNTPPPAAGVLGNPPPIQGPGERHPTPAKPAAPEPVLAPYVVANLRPFWAAVFLPDKGEVLTVGPRLLATFGRGGGVLRRYSLPDFQLKGTYPMPRAATRAVFDNATSTLYCTTLTSTRADNTIRDSEQVVAFGEVEAYDLGPVFDGTSTEKSDLKPHFVIPFASAKLTGLEASADRKWLFTVKTVPLGSATNPRGWKASLVRIDVARRKVLDPIELPTPVFQMVLAPDRKMLFLAEIPGAEGVGIADAVDVASWSISHNVVLSDSLRDVSISRDGSRLVCGVQSKETQQIVSARTAGGDVVEFDPAKDPDRVAGYVAVSSNGRRIVASARAAEGIDIYDVQDLGRKDGVRLMARGKEAAGSARTPLGGHFYLSPDGRFALFQVGAVVDVENPTKKPDTK